MISAALGKTPKEERSLTSQEGVGEWQKEEAKEDGRRQHRGCLSPATSTSPTVGRGAHPARAPAPAHSLKTRAPQRLTALIWGLRGWGGELGVLKSPQVVLPAKPGWKEASSPQGFRTLAPGARPEQRPGWSGRGWKDVCGNSRRLQGARLDFANKMSMSGAGGGGGGEGECCLFT